MTDEKDIKFTEKKIDQSWKENIKRDPAPKGAPSPKGAGPSSGEAPSDRGNPPPLEVDFSGFVTSLSFQVLMHFGDIENPLTKKKEKDLEAAKQTIDLLVMLKEKTKGNLSPDEEKLLSSLLADLELRYVELTGA